MLFNFLSVIYAFPYKMVFVRLEKLIYDKHSSVLQKSIIYGKKVLGH